MTTYTKEQIKILKERGAFDDFAEYYRGAFPGVEDVAATAYHCLIRGWLGVDDLFDFEWESYLKLHAEDLAAPALRSNPRQTQEPTS